MKMKLLTEEIKKKLPTLYSQEEIEDPIAVCKFFTPSSSFTWFVIEGRQEQDGDWLFFTKCFSHLCPDGELGYSTLKQLKEISGPYGLGVERDMHFKPKPISQCKR